MCLLLGGVHPYDNLHRPSSVSMSAANKEANFTSTSRIFVSRAKLLSVGGIKGARRQESQAHLSYLNLCHDRRSEQWPPLYPSLSHIIFTPKLMHLSLR